MSKSNVRHLFGPVPSRRLRRSLGVDLLPYKTCSFDCIFCQLGRTTRKTIEPREYVPTDEVIRELGTWLRADGTADYITLAGSGEPTLHAEFGRIIEFVHEATDIPVALLTNGSLLIDPEVREEASKADLVKVSLSAWDQASLEAVNRPHSAVKFDKLIEGQKLFRDQFRGELWIEVFLIRGINTAADQILKIAEKAKVIAPDEIQLNTVVRPPCEEYATAVSAERMLELAGLFEPTAEVIIEHRTDLFPGVAGNGSEIFKMIERRPCTLEQICGVSGLHRNEVSKYLGKLIRTRRIIKRRRGAGIYYSSVHDTVHRESS